jgi:lipoprotein signal peptidase
VHAAPMLAAGILVLVADRISKDVAAKRRLRRCTRFRETRSRKAGLFLIWLAAVGGILAAAWAGLFCSTPATVGASAAIAGAGSNLYDRLRRGAIVDFIDVGWWPVFNLADVAITLGVPAAIWFL